MSNFFIMAAVLIIFNLFMYKMDKKTQTPELLGPKEKACPPHRWRPNEQPGIPGTFYSECEICHKTPGNLGNT